MQKLVVMTYRLKNICIKEPPISFKEVLQSFGWIKDICITLGKECVENAVEQSIILFGQKLYKYKESATRNQTILKAIFQKNILYQCSKYFHCKYTVNNCKYIITVSYTHLDVYKRQILHSYMTTGWIYAVWIHSTSM